jgi:hypothetical protein
VRPAAAFVLVLAALAGACGRSPAAISVECTRFQAQQLNATTGDCLGPPVVTDGLNLCHDPSAAQAHGVRAACVVDAEGRLYRGSVTSTEWLEGAGWTHSELVMDASTLSAADEARCAAVLSGLPACP